MSGNERTERGVTFEERHYQDALEDLISAREVLRRETEDLWEATKRLQDWENEHDQDNETKTFLTLDQQVNNANQRRNDANQRLKDAYQRLNDACQWMKDARAAADKNPKRQKEDVSDELELLIKHCTSQGELTDTGDWDIDEWNEEDCGKMKDITMIANIVGFVSKNYFVPKETLKILEIFKKERGEDLLKNIPGLCQFVLMGTTGVGKSCILTLLCFWIALKHKHPVLLLRKISSGAQALYLLKDSKYYKWDDPILYYYWKLALNLNFNDCWRCFDGLLQDDIKNENLENEFHILATSGQFDVKNDGTATVTTCLVPFWTLADITSFGNIRGYSQEMIDERYFYSGGNLRDFLNDIDTTKNAVNRNITCIKNPSYIEQLQSLYGQSSDDQIDRIRMKTVKNVNNLNSYVDAGDWIVCITSKYLMIQLTEFQEPTFFQHFRDVAQSLNNDGLEGVALEGYFHSLVQEKKTLELKMIDYDNTDKQETSTIQQVRNELSKTVKFDVTKRSDWDQQSCWKIIEDWANNPSRKVDYLIPIDSNFQTIDAIARYKDGTKYEFWLLHVTKAKNHAMNIEIVLQISNIFDHYPVRYIAIVPDKTTRDTFRLQPAVVPPEILHKVSFHVAYFEVVDPTL